VSSNHKQANRVLLISYNQGEHIVMSTLTTLKGKKLNRPKLFAFLLLCQLVIAGCGSGPGDPDAPIDNPPSTEAGDLGTDSAPTGDGTGV